MVSETADALVRVMVKVFVAFTVWVAAVTSLAAVKLVIEAMWSPAGMPVPVMEAPTSAARKPAVFDEMLTLRLVVLPSVTTRGMVAAGALMVTVLASTTV